MKIIQKYVTASFLQMFAGALGVITFVIWLGIVYKMMDKMTEDSSNVIFLQLFVSGIPSSLVLSIPIACLIASLLLFGRLSSDGEISAMKACGINIFDVVSGPIVVSGILTVLCIYIHNSLAPMAHLMQRKANDDIGPSTIVSLMEEGKSVRDFIPGVTLYVERKTKNNELIGLKIDDHRDPSFYREFRAETGTVQVASNGNVVIVLWDVTITPWEKGRSDPLHCIRFPLEIPNPAKQSKYEAKEDDFKFLELLDKARNTAANFPHLSGKDLEIKHMTLAVEFNKRLSLSFSCLAFAMLGIPLGIKAHRKESSIGIAMSLVVVINFYLFIIAAQSLVKMPFMRSDIIVWLPVFLSIILGAWLLKRVN